MHQVLQWNLSKFQVGAVRREEGTREKTVCAAEITGQ